MPRLVRRAPLSERLKGYLDPYDFLLWLAEELNDDAYDEALKDWAGVLGVAANIVFVLARGSSKAGQSRAGDDVFGEVNAGAGWLVWFVSATQDPLREASMLTEHTGSSHCPLSDTPLLRERSLHFLPEAAVPPFRAVRRLCTSYILGAESPSG
jgi:hypothetical protein